MATSYNTSDVFGDIFCNILKNIATGVDDADENIKTFSFEPAVGMMKNVASAVRHGYGAYDVYEMDSAVHVLIDLPGIDKNDIKLDLVKQSKSYILKVQAERKPQLKNYQVVTERFTGVKKREVQLPSSIDPSSIQASFENGVLNIKCVKKVQPETSTTTSIPIL